MLESTNKQPTINESSGDDEPPDSIDNLVLSTSTEESFEHDYESASPDSDDEEYLILLKELSEDEEQVAEELELPQPIVNIDKHNLYLNFADYYSSQDPTSDRSETANDKGSKVMRDITAEAELDAALANSYIETDLPEEGCDGFNYVVFSAGAKTADLYLSQTELR